MAIYYYETEIAWTGKRTGAVTSPNLPPIVAGAPPEFNGSPGQWSPEHLFVASLNTCFVLTLLAVSENSKVAITSLTSAAKGKLEKPPEGAYQITEIVLRPRVVVARAEDVGRMGRLLEKAKENCFISNSIKTAIEIRPEIFHSQSQTIPCPPAGGHGT